MYLPKELSSITATRLIGHWHDDKVPVYDVSTVHGFNQIVGYIKHNNANNGTVLYRGQAQLHEKLIPSILHGTPSKMELLARNNDLSRYINKIVADDRMNRLLHFDASTKDRHFYKRHVVESMLQHYGLRTHFQDFVDNHWTALWFGLHELKKELLPDCSGENKYYQHYYVRRKPSLDAVEKAPACLSLKRPILASLPPRPNLYAILSASDYTEELLWDQKNARKLKNITDEKSKAEVFQRLVDRDIASREKKNQQLIKSWEKKVAKIESANQVLLKNYETDQESDVAYVYILLYVADTHGENFKGVYVGTETITIDLRKALPSVLLRPCAQHGWTVRRIGRFSDLSDGVVCVLRLKVALVDQMMGTGLLVSPENFFPPAEFDDGYRILLDREEPAPFGTPPPKYPRDLPSLFPFGTIQHYVHKKTFSP